MIGHGSEAVEAASIFQVWGETPVCGKNTMKNSLLLATADVCYQSEDRTSGNLFERNKLNNNNNNKNDVAFFRGDQLVEELRLAKERGFLFARKFQSGDQGSLELIEIIKKTIHNNNNS